MSKRKQRMNRAELADRRGTTPQAMGQLLRRHGIKPGADGLFDPRDVERLLDEGNGDGTGQMTLAEAIRRKEAALARLRELEL